MKIFISETDRQNARSVALKNLARFFEIKDWELKDNEKLFNELSFLKNKNSVAILKLLKEYFNAYDEWFKFYQKRKKIEDKTNKEYEFKAEEHSELGMLIKKREETLNALQEAFDELQIKDFNRKNFGSELSGIIIK